MRIRILLPAGALKRWHLELLRRLAASPNLSVAASLTHAAVPRADRASRFETHAHQAGNDGLSERLVASAFADFLGASESFDLTIDLGAGDAAASGPVWRLQVDGAAGEAALAVAAFERRAPKVEIVGPSGVIVAGRIGSDRRDDAQTLHEDYLARLITLIVAAAQGGGPAAFPALPDEAAPRPRPSYLKQAMAAAGRKLARDAYHLACHAPHWRVGWRKLAGPDLFDLRRHPASGWRDLPDDGSRFYADPFPLLHEGRVFLFVEDFEHRRGKGVISAVEFGPQGPLGVPQPVLEQPGHLSYPFVFERDGEVWMIPESVAAGSVDLYRATHFPGGWVRETTLVADVEASDVTLFQRGGVWWMFATVRDGGGSYSDALHLWSAADFRGPWKAHAANPVLVDIASARPAGRMIERHGQLYRPVQDCRNGYGAALALARVDRLDEGGFSQTVETRLTPGPLWPGRRLHTLNGAGGFEFIDGSATAFRWKSALSAALAKVEHGHAARAMSWGR